MYHASVIIALESKVRSIWIKGADTRERQLQEIGVKRRRGGGRGRDGGFIACIAMTYDKKSHFRCTLRAVLATPAKLHFPQIASRHARSYVSDIERG